MYVGKVESAQKDTLQIENQVKEIYLDVEKGLEAHKVIIDVYNNKGTIIRQLKLTDIAILGTLNDSIASMSFYENQNIFIVRLGDGYFNPPVYITINNQSNGCVRAYAIDSGRKASVIYEYNQGSITSAQPLKNNSIYVFDSSQVLNIQRNELLSSFVQETVRVFHNLNNLRSGLGMEMYNVLCSKLSIENPIVVYTGEDVVMLYNEGVCPYIIITETVTSHGQEVAQTMSKMNIPAIQFTPELVKSVSKDLTKIKKEV